jgi:DNA mismatch repair protein MutL
VDRQPIRQLSPLLVNRIAAGEVVERPASVVKELVENALDAGASHIVIEIEDGGRQLIRVADDGCGIPADELPLAFASHATSKLSADEDLFRITTMGFRGEALASIGSISQARIVSRPADQAVAQEITDHGGQIGPVQAAAANAGTAIEVRNLFFNTPARRKFMRSTATEFSHISQTVLRLALPFERISFRLLHNGRTALELGPSDRLARLLEAWPAEFREHFISIDEVFGDAGIVGIAGLPELARPTPVHQYLYLNGRHIRDKFISHALREAYRGLTEPGRHPAAVLLLTLPPDEVDVNVHPTKSEVRFRDGTRIHGMIQAAIRRKLSQSNLAPAAVAIRSADEARDEQRQTLQAKLADFFKQAPPVEPPLISAFTPVPANAEPWTPPPTPSPHTQGEGWGWGGGSAPAPEDTPAPQPQQPLPRIPAIQLHNSYLVAQSDDGLVIIDQHALHERIIYEELLERLQRGPLESQRLLIPQTFSASPRQMALLEQITPLLRRLGIEAEPFGPDSVAVNAFPSFLSRLEPGQFVCDLLDRGEQETLDLHDEELLHEVLDMMSCKAAVKAGDVLTSAEIEALLARRALVERASNCPHGRPTTLRMSLKDLEKQFKRTGF